jgi:hypothetical protein
MAIRHNVGAHHIAAESSDDRPSNPPLQVTSDSRALKDRLGRFFLSVSRELLFTRAIDWLRALF